jgi:hypothetical protein
MEDSPIEAALWPLLHPRRLSSSGARQVGVLSGRPSVWVLPSLLPCLAWVGWGAVAIGSSMDALSVGKIGSCYGLALRCGLDKGQPQ